MTWYLCQMKVNLTIKEKNRDFCIALYYFKKTRSPEGKFFFTSLFSLSKSCMHNEVALWSCTEIIGLLLWLGSRCRLNYKPINQIRTFPLEEKISVNRIQIAASYPRLNHHSLSHLISQNMTKNQVSKYSENFQLCFSYDSLSSLKHISK